VVNGGCRFGMYRSRSNVVGGEQDDKEYVESFTKEIPRLAGRMTSPSSAKIYFRPTKRLVRHHLLMYWGIFPFRLLANPRLAIFAIPFYPLLVLYNRQRRENKEEG
jgi:hypothetical protein